MVAPYYEDGQVVIYHGDCREVLSTISFDGLVTSPPYAEQRVALYGGVPEADYPAFTVEWMTAAAQSLAAGGSVLVNIREHIADGEMSDYVHRTRLAVRAAGWTECDELLWIKPDGPPVGHPGRPRRSWERILWFSQARQPSCYPKANGHATARLGQITGKASGQWRANDSVHLSAGIARSADYCVVSVGDRPADIDHPAVYPEKLAAWMMRTITLDGETVCDPFMGSGSTLVSAMSNGRKAIGIEVNEAYCEIAVSRLAQGSFDFGDEPKQVVV